MNRISRLVRRAPGASAATEIRRRQRRVAVVGTVLAAGAVLTMTSPAAASTGSGSGSLPPGYAAEHPWNVEWLASAPFSGPKSLASIATGQVITVPGSSTQNGTELTQAPDTAHALNQQWYFSPTNHAITNHNGLAWLNSIAAVRIKQTRDGQTLCMSAENYVDGYHVVQNPCTNGDAANQDWYVIPADNPDTDGWYLMSGLSVYDRDFLGAPGTIQSAGWPLYYQWGGMRETVAAGSDIALCTAVGAYAGQPDQWGACKKPLMLTTIGGPNGSPALRLRDHNPQERGYQRFRLDRRSFPVTIREDLKAWSDQLTYAYACPDGWRVGADAGHSDRVHYQAQFQSSNMSVDWAKFGQVGPGVNFQKLFENYGSQWADGNTWQTSNPNSTNTFTIKYRNWNTGYRWGQVTYFCEVQ